MNTRVKGNANASTKRGTDCFMMPT